MAAPDPRTEFTSTARDTVPSWIRDEQVRGRRANGWDEWNDGWNAFSFQVLEIKGGFPLSAAALASVMQT